LYRIKDKFKDLGYAEEDLRRLRSRKEYRGPGKVQLTAKSMYTEMVFINSFFYVVWSHLRPILEPGVNEEKTLRLERQLAIIRCRRRLVLATRYNEFRRTLEPSQWKYLPRTLEIAAFEAFSQHIEADVGVEIEATTFDDAFLKLPNLLAAAVEQRKSTLRALMGDTPREEGEIGADSIDLATAALKFTILPIHSNTYSGGTRLRLTIAYLKRKALVMSTIVLYPRSEQRPWN
jgi:hypothetical protein